MTETLSWTVADERALRLTVMDLHRVLRCMEEREAPPDLSWQSIQGRANFAQELWRKVQEGCHAATYTDESMRAQDKERLVKLQHQVDKACRRAREIAAERRGNEVDLIQEIFFPKNEEQDHVVNEERKDSGTRKDDDAPVEEDETDANNEHRHTVAERTSARVPMSAAQDVEELQKAQREQLETEIAHMAARLKESTQAMNTTLRTQTEELSVMEDLATKNVEKVGNVADSVTEHNKKSWRSTLATWTILFAVLGSFLFCMMTIRMVPKQRNKCLFFCATQKEVCNRMNDGSIVCVDTNGSPYVKKAAPVSRREAEEAEHAEECEVGSDGTCIAHLHTDLDEVKDDADGDAAEGDAAETYVCSQGECKALYEDEPEASESEEGESNCEACNKEGECRVHFEDEPEVSESSSDDTESMEQEQKDKERQEALDQVVGTGSAANVSSTGVSGAKDGGHESNSQTLQQDGQEDDKDPAAHTNQSSNGARGDGLETIEHDMTVTVEDIPVQEPVGSSGEADREVSFKPAEISTLYESFDED